MDIWQLADPKRGNTSGWLARSIPGARVHHLPDVGRLVPEEAPEELTALVHEFMAEPGPVGAS